MIGIRDNICSSEIEIGIDDEAIDLSHIPTNVRVDILKRWVMQKFLIVYDSGAQRNMYYLRLTPKLLADLDARSGFLHKPPLREILNNNLNRIVTDIDIDMQLQLVHNVLVEKISAINCSIVRLTKEYPCYLEGTILKMKGHIALLESYKEVVHTAVSHGC